jgi:hypothetical protein
LKKLLVLIAFLSLSLLSANSPAATLNTVDMKDTVDVEGNPLILQGMGAHKNFFGTVYVAGLYLKTHPKSADEAINVDEPKRLYLKFLQTVELSEIRKIIRTGFNENMPNADPELSAKVSGLLGAFNAEFDSHTTLVITYVPGGGTTVEKETRLSGTQLIGWFGGHDFMRALFTVWLGAVPHDAEVKSGMLGMP